jgi:hypothetical protein
MSASIVNAIAIDQEEADIALEDAESAYRGVSALVELLAACKPGQQITGIFVHSLLVDVRMHLENVVGSLRVPMARHAFQPLDMQ